MIEEATKNARTVAENSPPTRAAGSGTSAPRSRASSRSRTRRDDPHIKKVRVVATVEYHLAN
jgi:hypothetical protein